ncbi:LolA family protein [Arthrobacter agilis]|uniref:LolA family protein n=1 Tax=Arthrobacter agilis TaxID=37921 RepID=UPI002789F0B0|nr:sigma-E factor regulatory protein RseB domain-containing protein [Arthrobacter agilis]MDQ0733830.1 outer membrane lipoprotein-sorting protein [Arthrobacter agilis]
MNKNWRWLPAGIVPVVIVAAAVSGSAVAEAQPQLPAKTAQELLEFVATSSDDAYSGTVEQSSDLGLPDLSMATPPGRTSSSDPTSTALELMTGEHTARVYVDGTEKMRVQVLDQLAQRDVVVNGSDAWYYDSESNEATHAALPDKDALKADLEAKLQEKIAEHPELKDLPRTPAEVAEMFLAQIDPTTEVTVEGTSRVAGRSAYELVLTPEDDATLIGSISVSVDSETGVPLNVTVLAKGQEEAAFSAGFSSVDFSAPAADVFAFTPPAGATVTEAPTADEVKAELEARKELTQAPAEAPQQSTVIGDGWSTIVKLPAGSAAGLGMSPATSDAAGMGEIMEIKPGMDPEEVAGAQALLEQALTEVDGGQALQTSLVSVLITDDGRILAGAVGVDQLVAASRQ